MKYLIIEDEMHNAQLLKNYIQQIKSEAILLEIIPSVSDAVQWFKANLMPDMVFMDIRLEDGLSLEIFNTIEISCPVIFTTAYNEYALDAFKVFGAAYLLKPISKKELTVVIDKFYTENQQDNTALKQMLSQLLQPEKKYKQQLVIHHKDQILTLPTTDIDYIYIENKITYILSKDKTSYIVPYTLEELENQLDSSQFFRVNRQYILALDSFQSIHKYFNDKGKITLKNNPNAEIILSRSRFAEFKDWLDR
jgi:two-component system, LytTR family, response regulator LytT